MGVTQVNIKLLKNGIMPTKGSDGAAGYDLYVPQDTIVPHGRSVIKLGFAIQLPEGFKAEIQPRSGYSSKGFEGFSLIGKERRFNCDVKYGLIDEDFRGEVGVIVKNDGPTFTIRRKQRIAQMVISKVPETYFSEVDSLDETERGEGGFGSTGK